MQRSKLEVCENILDALLKKPLTFNCIAYEANLDDTSLKHNLTFLMETDIIEERIYRKKVVYAITNRGVAICRALHFQKNLVRVKNIKKAVEKAVDRVIKVKAKY
jgi:predicted transcriptional regulator